MFNWLSLILFLVIVLLLLRDARREKNVRLRSQEARKELDALQKRIGELEASQKEKAERDRTYRDDLFEISVNLNLYCQLAGREAETASLKEKLRVLTGESQKLLERLQ